MSLFTQKFEEAKKLRSVRLTDTAWDALERIASEHGVTRTDLLEKWARQEPVSPQASSPCLTREELEKHMNTLLAHIPIGRKEVAQRAFVIKHFQALLQRIFPK
jgi:transposase-like protein